MSGSHHHHYKADVDTSAFLAMRDARLRLLAMMLLAFSYSSIKDLSAIPFMLLVTSTLWLLSGLTIRYLLKRLFYPSFFVLFLALALLLFAGHTVIYKLGFVTITREGLHAAILVSTRFYCILTLVMVFLSTSSLLTNIVAMRALKLPYIMVDMALLMMRYLEVLKQDIQSMNIAMCLRGHENRAWSLKTIKTSAWLAGSLLVRSYERADGVYKAMRLRGYGQENVVLYHQQLGIVDWLFFAAIVLVAVGFFVWAS